MASKKRRGRKPLAADVVRLELRLPKALATLAEEAAKRDGIVTAEWWRRAALLALAAGEVR